MVLSEGDVLVRDAGRVREGSGGVMVRTFDRGERTVWVMPRDESMLTWFQIVRIANVQSVRWVLGALNDQLGPVSVRRAQSWCARMETAGLVGRAQLRGAGGSLVWATYAGTGQGSRTCTGRRRGTRSPSLPPLRGTPPPDMRGSAITSPLMSADTKPMAPHSRRSGWSSSRSS